VLVRLREHLGDKCPSAVRFAVGPLPEPGAEGETSSKRTVPKVSAAAIAEGDRVAHEIEDPRLREAVARAVAVSLAARGDPPADRSV
jgi:hypothetical protein